MLQRLKTSPATWRRGFISLETKVSLNITWNIKRLIFNEKSFQKRLFRRHLLRWQTW